MAGLGQNDLLLMKQKIEVLAGERGDKQQAAIRMAYLKTLQDIIGKLRGSTNDIQQAVSALDSSLEQTQQQLNAVQGSVNNLQIEVDELDDTLDQITTDVSHIQSDLSTATSDLGQLTNDIAELQVVINDLENSAGNTNQELIALKQSASNVIIPAPQQGNISTAPTMINFNALVADISSLHQSIVNLKNSLA